MVTIFTKFNPKNKTAHHLNLMTGRQTVLFANKVISGATLSVFGIAEVDRQSVIDLCESAKVPYQVV